MKLKIILASVVVLVACGMIVTKCWSNPQATENVASQKKYKEISRPTQYPGTGVNEVKGIILHHTAEPTVENAIAAMNRKHLSTHVVIDTDGTRYVMAQPEVVTSHAGKSSLHGRTSCNKFCVGIELQGNTLENPLTDDQIKSAIQYIIPLMKKYNIPIENVVTHEMVRDEWNKNHPNDRGFRKVDITQTEYKRIMKQLRAALKN